ncbi:arginine--tRNA ligase [Candidatus Izemoplasma sp. B36]|uniref:arginine--tRNA ligase n=1 Tax=Candidatus Izemoplasma sp. B36 TaxID=3242468 RepID=UPI003557764D
MINNIKTRIKKELELKLKEIFKTDISVVVEEPKKVELGDISIPVFSVVKVVRKPLPQVLETVIDVLKTLKDNEIFEQINSVSGFINITLNKEKFSKLVIEDYNNSISNYGSSKIGENKTVCIDYSSPNIAKPFSVGHLRSTIIGHSIGNILEKCGYKVVRINHLGDFGTQFGKTIYAYLNWGNEALVKKNPVGELVKLYVEFNERAKTDKSIEDEARKIFTELENGNPKYVKLWEIIREESLKEYMKVYKLLNVSFDSYNGEAFYNDKMQAVVDELKTKSLLKKDQGAMIVDLGEKIPPALIQKSDGSTLYITRDLAALFYRKNTYNFDEVLYVVGNEQKLHFDQLKKVVSLMGYDFAEDIHHINFGLVLQDGKKMSTRKGKVVKLEDVLKEASTLSLDYINEKNPGLENKEETAEKIGVSAVIFNDLKNLRTNDFEFNLEDMVAFVGQTGPYLQYTSVRIKSILTSVTEETEELDFSLFNEGHYFEIIKNISQYEDTIIKSKEDYAPSILAKYLLNLASLFNSFYAKEKVMVEDLVERNTKLQVLRMVRNILNDGMDLLGMSVIQKM